MENTRNAVNGNRIFRGAGGFYEKDNDMDPCLHHGTDACCLRRRTGQRDAPAAAQDTEADPQTGCRLPAGRGSGA